MLVLEGEIANSNLPDLSVIPFEERDHVSPASVDFITPFSSTPPYKILKSPGVATICSTFLTLPKPPSSVSLYTLFQVAPPSVDLNIPDLFENPNLYLPVVTAANTIFSSFGSTRIRAMLLKS